MRLFHPLVEDAAPLSVSTKTNALPASLLKEDFAETGTWHTAKLPVREALKEHAGG